MAVFGRGSVSLKSQIVLNNLDGFGDSDNFDNLVDFDSLFMLSFAFTRQFICDIL